MDFESAFKIINNLHVREGLRKFQPQWSTVVLTYDGALVDIIKHKEEPNLKLNKEHLEKYPNTIQFTAWQGRFNSVNELLKTIDNSVDLGKKY